MEGVIFGGKTNAQPEVNSDGGPKEGDASNGDEPKKGDGANGEGDKEGKK